MSFEQAGEVSECLLRASGCARMLVDSHQAPCLADSKETEVQSTGSIVRTAAFGSLRSYSSFDVAWCPLHVRSNTHNPPSDEQRCFRESIRSLTV
jgi:hypothetical protein